MSPSARPILRAPAGAPRPPLRWSPLRRCTSPHLYPRCPPATGAHHRGVCRGCKPREEHLDHHGGVGPMWGAPTQVCCDEKSTIERVGLTFGPTKLQANWIQKSEASRVRRVGGRVRSANEAGSTWQGAASAGARVDFFRERGVSQRIAAAQTRTAASSTVGGLFCTVSGGGER